MSNTRLTACDQLARLQAGELSCRALVDSYLENIEKRDPAIGAFLTVDREQARGQADRIDRRRAAGEKLGPLAGLPVAVKDLFCTTDMPTTCASKILEGFQAPYDATVISRLRAADAVLIGKTNMDEFAMGASTENSAYQKTNNPWDTSRTPGGSSGGAAACIAADMCSLSVGTDTGGSIRQPASHCGVVGLKPTYGRVSRYGLIAFASSLDQAGPVARTVEDTALLLDVLAGHDPFDSTSANEPTQSYSTEVTKPLDGLRVGIVPEQFGEGLEPAVEKAIREAITLYESLGAKVVELSLPHSKYAVATYYVIAPSEASSNLSRYDAAHYGYRTDEKQLLAELEAEREKLEAAGDQQGLKQLDSPLVRMYRKSRSEGFGPEVKRRIMVGTYALSAGYYDAYYLKALKVRRLIRQDYQQAFQQVDVIAGPVAPTTAFKIGEKTDDPLAMYLVDLYTAGANLAGIPAISVPCGFADGLPIGLQLQAAPFDESRLLRAAYMYQTNKAWDQETPQLP